MAHKKRKTHNDIPDKKKGPSKSSKPTGDMINEHNNNQNNEMTSANEPNVERASNTGIGDAAVNDKKLTRYRSNRSTDA